MSDNLRICGESEESRRKRSTLVAKTLLKESDRGCAILAAALLGDALEDLLRSFFRQSEVESKAAIDPLFHGYAPLSTLSAKIQVAYALAILPRKLRDQIEVIRRLRNDSAHEWGPIDFEDPRCSERLALLVGRSDRQASLDLENQDHARCLAPRQEQLARRLALVLVVSDILGELDALVWLARKGQDIHQLVLLKEESPEA